jgi:basic membrane protein A
MKTKGELKMRRSMCIGCAAVLLLAATLTAGCGGATPTTETSEPTATGGEPCRVALVLPGSIADAGFNAGAYDGLKEVEETYGCEVAYSEMVPVADYEETFRGYASEGYDLVIGNGFEFGDPVEKVAPDFPDTIFLVTRGVVAGPNYSSLFTDRQEGDYVAGYIAGLMTKTNKVAGIGGFQMPNIIMALEAYKLGAQASNPDVEVAIAYIDSFDDVGLGKEAALAQISAGADVVFHIADAAGMGVIQACKEKGVWAEGSNYDQNELAPDTVLTSTINDTPAMLVAAVGQMLDGTLEMGVINHYGLASGVVRMAPYHGLVPDDIAAQAEEVQQKIISGELEVPQITTPSQ